MTTVILMNVGVLLAEHHDMSEDMENSIEAINKVFIAFYCVEQVRRPCVCMHAHICVCVCLKKCLA